MIADLSVELIGPEKAERYLALRRDGPAARVTYVRRLAEIMRSGEWHLEMNPIKFARDGSLVDGRHRLLAVVEAGRTVEMLVLRGTEPEDEILRCC